MLRDELLYLVDPALSRLLDGEKRVDLHNNEFACVAYYVGNVIRIDLKPKNAPPPSFSLPADLEERIANCQYCGGPIRWGTTHKGNKAPFNVEPPHENHFGTCPRTRGK